MKDLDWCDMNDEMDFYLSRCVKNWAAQQQPPPGGRTRLLETASSPAIEQRRYFDRLLYAINLWLFTPDHTYHNHEWSIGPITQSRAWSFHLVADGAWPTRTFMHA